MVPFSTPKIWPLFELLTKIRIVLTSSCSQNLCVCSHSQVLINSNGKGVSTAKIYKYEDKLEIPDGGGGVQMKKPSVREVWTSFWIHTFGKTGAH